MNAIYELFQQADRDTIRRFLGNKSVFDVLMSYEAAFGSVQLLAYERDTMEAVIDKYISNELRKDGGDIELVDVKGNTVYVKLSGNCQMCKNAQLTLKNFVENTLREHVNPNIIVEKV